MNNISLSIIIPTYNERDNIEILIPKIDTVLKNIKIPYEIVIVDDNSPDGTAEFAEMLSKTYPIKVVKRPGKLGLSSAVLDGFKISEGSMIAVMDADLQHPPEVLPNMLEKIIKDQCDVVIASRYIRGGSAGGLSPFRRLVSQGAILIAKLLLPCVRKVRDPMSGYFMFKREVIKDVTSKMNPRGFKILLEVLVMGKVGKVCEVPYTFGKRQKGQSKLKPSEIINYLVHILDLYRRKTSKCVIVVKSH